MLPLGHSSAGYLISQATKKRLGTKEVLLVMLCANILDFDLFLPNLFGFPAGIHHYFPIHTPIAVLIIWMILWVWLRKKISKEALILSGVAMLSHLVLDDLSYWLSLIGLEERMRPQIFWLYPFDPRYAEEFRWIINKRISEGLTSTDVLKIYLFTLPRLFYLEIILTGTAIGVWIRKRYKSQKAKIGAEQEFVLKAQEIKDRRKK